MDDRLIFLYCGDGATKGRGGPGRPSYGTDGPSVYGGRTGKSAGLEPEARRDAETTVDADRLTPYRPEKLLSDEVAASVPQTDTGGQVEQTKARGRNHVKELGKLTPQLREKGCLSA